MKIEFCSEVKADGMTAYFTQIDEVIVDNTLDFSYEKAYQIYLKIIENKGEIGKVKIIESKTI